MSAQSINVIKSRFKVSNINCLPTNSAILKSSENLKIQNTIEELNNKEDVPAKDKTDDNKKHIKWAEELTEIKKFTKAYTKKRSDEIREIAKNTTKVWGKSILTRRLSDYPEDFIDTAPSTPRDEEKISKKTIPTKNINKGKVRGSKSLLPKRNLATLSSNRFERELEAKLHNKYGFISRITVY